MWDRQEGHEEPVTRPHVQRLAIMAEAAGKLNEFADGVEAFLGAMNETRTSPHPDMFDQLYRMHVDPNYLPESLES